MATRMPVAAGTFYPSNPVKLAKEIESCFRNGPGAPGKPTDRKIVAAVVPHAGYPYSGPVAACAYKVLAGAKQPDTVIIIGLDHRGLGTAASVWQGSAWETPLGKLEIDYALGKNLLGLDTIFNKELDPHMEEHSIEVQLPFLQAIYKDWPKILPISVSAPPDIMTARRMGDAIYRAAKGRNAVLLASSDFTHYGISYGYFPFFGTPAEIEKQVHDSDMAVISSIEQIRPDEVIDAVKRKGLTICGAMPIAILLNALAGLKIEKGKLLKYATSAETTGDRENFVGYAAVVFEK